MTRPVDISRVLVVDDDDSIRVLVMTMLRRSGFEADGASSGAEALSLIEKRDYDAILLDLMMPLMSGFEVLARLTKSGRSQRVIIMSAAPPEVIAETRKMNVSATIQKPFRLERVVQAVQEALASDTIKARADEPAPPARLPMKAGEPAPLRSSGTPPSGRPAEARNGDEDSLFTSAPPGRLDRL